ncbi:MAG: cupredoxin domain-containing protein [Candidatus Eiseniibacteriota bacterium]
MRLSALPAAGLVALAAVSPAKGTIHTVTQVGTSFSPASVTVEVGDTVKWNWSVGIHDVLSGTGPTDPQAGVLFHSALSAGVPTFSVVFNTPGTFPYFCSPHFAFGMIGVVNVNLPTSAPEVEATSWSRVKHLYR